MKELNLIPISELISYIAIYRLYKINKEMAKKCMEEVALRNQWDYAETEIGNEVAVLSSIGSGFVAKYKENIDLNELKIKIRNLQCNCMVFNKENNLLHVGNPSQEIIDQISNLEEIIEVYSDKKEIVKNVGTFSSKIS